jgi:hypothetical protein
MSFATCAIEGNKFAIYMMELYNRDRNQFEVELNEWLNKDGK